MTQVFDRGSLLASSKARVSSTSFQCTGFKGHTWKNMVSHNITFCFILKKLGFYVLINFTIVEMERGQIPTQLLLLKAHLKFFFRNCFQDSQNIILNILMGHKLPCFKNGHIVERAWTFTVT